MSRIRSEVNSTHRGWKPLALPELRRLPSPVYVRVQSLAARHRFPMHHHRWHQLIYAISGSLTVAVEDHWVVISPEQAIWIPAGIEHAVGSTHGAEFRSLYVDAKTRVAMPAGSAVVKITPLMRELILEAAGTGTKADARVYRNKVCQLILAHLPRLSLLKMSLPWPRTPMLRQICETLYLAPADQRSMADWGSQLGASSRTLTRHFQEDVGLTFREWKRRMRLVKSLELLGAGLSVTATSLTLGYGSTSAFSFMFMREMGYSPRQHLVASG